MIDSYLSEWEVYRNLQAVQSLAGAKGMAKLILVLWIDVCVCVCVCLCCWGSKLGPHAC
jgi:hypothetical protein